MNPQSWKIVPTLQICKWDGTLTLMSFFLVLSSFFYAAPSIANPIKDYLAPLPLVFILISSISFFLYLYFFFFYCLVFKTVNLQIFKINLQICKLHKITYKKSGTHFGMFAIFHLWSTLRITSQVFFVFFWQIPLKIINEKKCNTD